MSRASQTRGAATVVVFDAGLSAFLRYRADRACVFAVGA